MNQRTTVTPNLKEYGPSVHKTYKHNNKNIIHTYIYPSFVIFVKFNMKSGTEIYYSCLYTLQRLAGTFQWLLYLLPLTHLLYILYRFLYLLLQVKKHSEFMSYDNLLSVTEVLLQSSYY